MEWQANWDDPFSAYLHHFSPLIGDKRTGVTLEENPQRQHRCGRLVCRRIAALLGRPASADL